MLIRMRERRKRYPYQDKRGRKRHLYQNEKEKISLSEFKNKDRF